MTSIFPIHPSLTTSALILKTPLTRLPMSNLPLEIVEMFGQTIGKVVPITAALALVFTVLTHFWACNPGTPWWRKRELVTDVCYWFFVPLITRVVRIGLLVLG